MSIVKLVADIMTGKIPPVLRKIQSAKYGIEIGIIRNLLQELLVAGIIEKDKVINYILLLFLYSNRSLLVLRVFLEHLARG